MHYVHAQCIYQSVLCRFFCRNQALYFRLPMRFGFVVLLVSKWNGSFGRSIKSNLNEVLLWLHVLRLFSICWHFLNYTEFFDFQIMQLTARFTNGSQWISIVNSIVNRTSLIRNENEHKLWYCEEISIYNCRQFLVWKYHFSVVTKSVESVNLLEFKLEFYCSSIFSTINVEFTLQKRL